MLSFFKMPKWALTVWAKHRTTVLVGAIVVLTFSEGLREALLKAAFAVSYLVLAVIAVKYVRMTRAAESSSSDAS